MEVDLTPPQPAEVAEAVASALDAGAEAQADPWWRAGIEESLGIHTIPE
jgi:hypothetical protein